MGFQSGESGVPGEGSFPARQHSCALRREGDGAPSGGPEAHFHSSRIQPPLCRPGLPRAAALRANKAPFMPRAASSRALAAADGLAPARHPAARARGPAGAHRARFRRALCPGDPGSVPAGSAVRIARNPPSFLGGGSADTESFQRGNPPFAHDSLGTKMPVSRALSRAPHPCPSGWYGPSSQVVRGLCFSS